VLAVAAAHDGSRRGGAVQVDSIKTRVESAPDVCNQRLKLKCDEPLSNVAFNFNVRRYTEADFFVMPVVGGTYLGRDVVGRCRLTVSKRVLKAPLVSALDTLI
jgi:hypothetical protein